jgi:transposase
VPLGAGCPKGYGPRKTIYNRFVRWAVRRIWENIFETLAASGGPPAEAMLDSTHIKVHRSSGGAKGGLKNRRSVVLVAGRIPKST